jgi:hypothetical protein
MKKVFVEEGTGRWVVTVSLDELEIAEQAIWRFKNGLKGEAERIAHKAYPEDCPRDCPKVVAAVDKVCARLTKKVEEWDGWYCQVMSDAEERVAKLQGEEFKKIWGDPQEKPAKKEKPVKKSAKKRPGKKGTK